MQPTVQRPTMGFEKKVVCWNSCKHSDSHQTLNFRQLILNERALVQSTKATFHHTQFSSESMVLQYTYFFNECSVSYVVFIGAYCLIKCLGKGKVKWTCTLSKARLQNVHVYTCPETANYHRTLHISYFINIQSTTILYILNFFMVQFKSRNCQRMHTNVCKLTQQMTCVHCTMDKRVKISYFPNANYWPWNDKI